jgi:hypothetical protein
MRRTTFALATCLALLLALAATSEAAVDTIGSDLSGTGTTAIQRTEDTALAQLTGARAQVPNSGQVVSVDVKGCSAKTAAQNPETAIFVQDLRGSGGAQEVISTSQQFHLPICGAGADAGTVTTFRPTDQCVNAGNLVGVVVGGQTPGYPQGTEYFVAKSSPGAGLGAFSKNFGAVTGARIDLAPIPDTELLMQARIGSGSDSPSRCPGGGEPSGGGGGGGGGGGSGGGSTGGGGKGEIASAALEIKKGVATIRGGSGGITASCALPAGQTCQVSLVAGIGRGGATAVGTIVGAIPGGGTDVLKLRLNKAGKQALRKRKRLTLILRGTLKGAGGSAKVTRKLPIRAG